MMSLRLSARSWPIGLKADPMKVSFVPLDATSATAWDEFCDRSDDAWFWHSRAWLDYSLAYQPELQPQTRSFLAVHESQVVGICPLLRETYRDSQRIGHEFSWSGDACLAPALANELGPAR